MQITKLLAGVALSCAALAAQAGISFSLSQSSTTSQVGASVLDLGTYAVNNSGAVQTTSSNSQVLLTGTTDGGLGYTIQGGALYNATTGISGYSARPAGTAAGSTWYSTGTSGQTSPGTVSFSNGIDYFGLLWGSPDTYNSLNFYNGSTLVGSLTGTDLNTLLQQPGFSNGNWSSGVYVNAFATGSDFFTSVQLVSTSNAFEVANMSAKKLPEPATYVLALLGMAVAVRKSKKAA